MKRYLTSESVCEGHPDKLCDYIADSVLDACLRKDPNSRVACEVLATKAKIVVAGEITCNSRINIREVVKGSLIECGYCPDEFTISVFIHPQSLDIARGVNNALEAREEENDAHELGAGDQGTMYGYATDECDERIPLPLKLAHRICLELDEARKRGFIKGIKSDGKAQVTVEYEDDTPKRIEAIVVSIQHDKNIDLNELKEEIILKVLCQAFCDYPFDTQTKILINPSGRFVTGGPAADTGLTGRKLMVDTYGGLALHGGGALCGKDPTKVDRSAAYMARFIAKHIVSLGLAKRCTVSISYAIGKAEPVAVHVDTFSTGKIDDEKLTRIVKRIFPLKPREIIEVLNLKIPVYNLTSCYGHFGNLFYSWENTNTAFAKALAKEAELAH